jgi:hypothetical protein
LVARCECFVIKDIWEINEIWPLFKKLRVVRIIFILGIAILSIVYASCPNNYDIHHTFQNFQSKVAHLDMIYDRYVTI